MKHSFLERLHSPDRPVIVFDGAMGTNLQKQNLTAEDFGGPQYEGCNEYLVFHQARSSGESSPGLFGCGVRMSSRLTLLVVCR